MATFVDCACHRMQIAFVVLFLLDAVVFASTGTTLRFSRFFRPAILVGRHRELRRTYFIISSMFYRLLKVFTMLIGFLGFFGMIAIHVFQPFYQHVDEQVEQLEVCAVQIIVVVGFFFVVVVGCLVVLCHTYSLTHTHSLTHLHTHSLTHTHTLTHTCLQGAFDNFPRAFLRLFVLFTTENYPVVVTPAYEHNSASFVFYFAFVYAGVFFLTTMLLGLVCGSLPPPPHPARALFVKTKGGGAHVVFFVVLW